MLTEFWTLLRATARAWVADHVPRLGAALAFYSMLSVGPLLLLALSAAAVIFGDEAAQGRILDQIDGLLGHDGARAIQDMLAASAAKKESTLLATVVGLATLLVGASGVFGQLQDALNTIWGVEPKPGRSLMRMIRERFLSFSMVLGSGFLLLVSLVLSASISALGAFGADLFPGMETVLQLVNAAVSFAIVTALFALMFKYLPDALVAWRDVWVGAVMTSALFTLGKAAIGLYLGQSALGSAYGAAGSLVVVLVWIYYSSQILFFGAEFTKIYALSRGMELRPTASAQLIRHGAA